MKMRSDATPPCCFDNCRGQRHFMTGSVNDAAVSSRIDYCTHVIHHASLDIDPGIKDLCLSHSNSLKNGCRLSLLVSRICRHPPLRRPVLTLYGWRDVTNPRTNKLTLFSFVPQANTGNDIKGKSGEKYEMTGT